MCADLLTTASTARVSSSAYGAEARTRCCAWMIREDAMSSWARVILAVDWIARIRCLTARSCAPMLCRLLRRLRLRWDALVDRIAADLVLAEWLGRLVGHQQPA